MKHIQTDIRVARAAIRKYEQVYSVPAPGKHSDVIKMMAEKGFTLPVTGQHGFLLTNGEFATLKEAGQFALAVGQCTNLIDPPNLSAEDLWPVEE